MAFRWMGIKIKCISVHCYLYFDTMIWMLRWNIELYSISVTIFICIPVYFLFNNFTSEEKISFENNRVFYQRI